MKDIEYYLKKIFDVNDLSEVNYGTLRDGDRVSYTLDEINNRATDFHISVESEYGGEDMGSEYWYVFKFYDHSDYSTAYIKFEGLYNSWSDTEWFEYPRLVKPVEVTVIQFEDI